VSKNAEPDGNGGKIVEVITPTSTLADKIQRNEGESAEPLFAAAEATIDRQATDYLGRLRSDLTEVKSAIDIALSSDDQRDAAVDRLFALIHNMKGQATTFGYPLVSQIGALTCSILQRSPPADEARLRIVKAHIDALSIVIEHNLAGNGGELGTKLVERLEGLSAASA
jgi:HPt (histidine-containing phosphotransfer) domain-containing protein